MTDNLKTQIAEAIEKAAGSIMVGNTEVALLDYLEVGAIAQAVLDIVEPMIPKWGDIKDAPTEYAGIMYFYGKGYTPKSVHFNHEYKAWYDDYSCLPISDFALKYTHYYIIPTTPEKE